MRNSVNNALRSCVAGFALGLGCVTAACDSRQPPAAPTTITSTTTVTNVDANGLVHVVGSSWTLEIDASVRYESVSKSGLGDQSGVTTTINGVPFEIRDGRFFLGQVDLGAVPPGAKARVAADGVFVDGERRGDTPKRADPSGG